MNYSIFLQVELFFPEELEMKFHISSVFPSLKYCIHPFLLHKLNDSLISLYFILAINLILNLIPLSQQLFHLFGSLFEI